MYPGNELGCMFQHVMRSNTWGKEVLCRPQQEQAVQPSLHRELKQMCFPAVVRMPGPWDSSWQMQITQLCLNISSHIQKKNQQTKNPKQAKSAVALDNTLCCESEVVLYCIGACAGLRDLPNISSSSSQMGSLTINQLWASRGDITLQSLIFQFNHWGVRIVQRWKSMGKLKLSFILVFKSNTKKVYILFITLASAQIWILLSYLSLTEPDFRSSFPAHSKQKYCQVSPVKVHLLNLGQSCFTMWKLRQDKMLQGASCLVWHRHISKFTSLYRHSCSALFLLFSERPGLLCPTASSPAR